jgi:hypothetical protein
VTDGEAAVLRPPPLETTTARSSTSTPSSTPRRPPPQGSSSGACFVLLADALPFFLSLLARPGILPSLGSADLFWAHKCGVARAVGGGNRRCRGGGEQGQAVADHRCHGKLYYNVEEIGYANCSMKCRICATFDCTGPIPIVMVSCESSKTSTNAVLRESLKPLIYYAWIACQLVRLG